MAFDQPQHGCKEQIHNIITSKVPNIVSTDLDELVENLFMVTSNQVNSAILWQKRFVIHPLECRLRDEQSTSRKRNGFGNATFLKTEVKTPMNPDTYPPCSFMKNIEKLFNEPKDKGLEAMKHMTFLPSVKSELFNCNDQYTVEQFIMIAKKSSMSHLDAGKLAWRIMPIECRKLLRSLKA